MAGNTQTIIFGTLTAIIGALGIPGNVLVLAVYLPKCQRGSSQVLVVWMAVLDLLCSLFVSLPQSYQLLTSIQVEPFCRIRNFLLMTTSFITFQVTAVVAVDRYLAICHPHKKLMTVRRAHIITAVNCVVGVIVSSPTLLLFQVIDIGQGHMTNICTIVWRLLPWLRVLSIARFVAFFALAIVIIVLYSRIAFVIRKRRKVCPLEVRPSDHNPADRSTIISNVASSVTMDEPSHPAKSGTSMKMSNSKPHGQGISGCTQNLPSTSGTVNRNTMNVRTEETDLDTDYYLHKPTGNSLLVPDDRSTNDIAVCSDYPSSDYPSTVTISRRSDAVHVGIQGSAEPSRGPVRAKPTRKKQETYADRVRNKTSRMLLVIAIIVVITYAPQILVIIVAGSTGSDESSLRNLMIDLTSFVALFNSALNPLIYTFLNSKFRIEVRNTWRKLRNLLMR